MRCCVSFCVNNSEILPDPQNVTFHRLPTEKCRRAAWIQALGIEEKNMQRLRGPFICSLHFREEDFYTTKSGQRAVQRGAVPKTEQICIICLDTGRRMFSLNYYNLEQPYENVTGISLSKFTAVRSPRVCWECGQRLLNCDAFRGRSVRAHHLLLKLSREDEQLKIQTIKTVNRKKHKLKSNISKEIFEPDYSDYQFVYDEKSQNVKTENREKNKNVKVKMEKVIYGEPSRETKTEVKNEGKKLTIILEPKEEGVNDIASDEEFLHDDIDNDGFLNGAVDKIIKNIGITGKSNKNDSCKNVKLLNKSIEVDVEFPNHDIDGDINVPNVNDHNVSYTDKNDIININLPGQDNDFDMDFLDENVKITNENVNNFHVMNRNVCNVHAPDRNDDIHDNNKFMNKNVNLPDGTDDCDMDFPDDMDVSDRNDSDIELVELTVKSENTEKCVNKTKVKINKKGTLSKVKRKTKVKVNKSKVALNKFNKDGKVKKSSRKRKTEFQGHYLRRKPPTGGMELFKVSVLTYEQQIADIQCKKDTPLYKNSTYKCTYCYKGYQFEDAFEAHMEQHTDKYGEFECAICGIHTSSRQKLLHHLNMTHIVRYSCTMCPFYTRHRNTAKSHGRWHNGTKTKCPHCDDVEFSKLTSLMSHIRKKHPSDCVCALCGFSFIGERGLALHVKMKHQFEDTQAPLTGPLCVECNIRFASQTAYEQHLVVSLRHTTEDKLQRNEPTRRKVTGPPRRRGELTITCEQCGVKLKGFKHYTYHFKRQHRDQTRTQFANAHERCLCEQCGRVFQHSSALKSHMLVHSGKKDVQCAICDKRFYHQRQLTMHMEIHSEPKRTFDCPVCARSFTSKSNKNRHLWTHTQVSRPFKCHACPKTFVYPSERKIHINHAHANQPYPKKSKNRVRNSRPKHVKEVPYGQIGPHNSINEASYSSETSAMLNE
ncbi:zinc finger protein 420-like [Maniola hyperantus]|uniref:zinc finger protein 420-like n=1 Tax=Aphantopus hyperantus TaxID=2795564 RepID=UPI00212EEAB7